MMIMMTVKDWYKALKLTYKPAIVFFDKTGNEIIRKDGVIKDLKIKGTQSVVKVGTKVKNIRLCDGDHDIDYKIPGFGGMKLLFV
jgi:protein PhnA